MTAIACIVFGYLLIVRFLSQLHPIASILGLMITFFIPFMSKKEFLTISFFYSAAVTGITFVRRDILTPFLGADIFTLLGVATLLVLALILQIKEPVSFLMSLHPAVIQSAGIIFFFAAAALAFIIGSIELLALLRILKIYRKVGMVPERWYLWRRRSC